MLEAYNNTTITMQRLSVCMSTHPLLLLEVRALCIQVRLHLGLPHFGLPGPLLLNQVLTLNG